MRLATVSGGLATRRCRVISQSALGVVSGCSDDVMHGGEVGSDVSFMHARRVWSS